MFKTSKKITSLLLALCMLLSIAPMGVLASDTINYVSIGASNVNGYGLAGYFDAEAKAAVEAAPLSDKTAVKMSGNVYGYERAPEGSYPELIADYLASEGDTVVHNQLAISSMRVEEVRVLLDNTYYGDFYTEWRFTDGANWFNNALPGGLEALRADYQTKIAAADVVTLDIGANNFGVFLQRCIIDGYANQANVSNISPEIGDMYAEAKDFVIDLLAERDIVLGADIEDMVEALTYALVGYCYNFDKVVEKIYELNPDAQVVIVSVQNLMDGKNIKLPGDEELIPFGDIMGALVNAANVYTAALSPFAGKYAYADVRKDGHVNFFADQLLAWDGIEPLDSDIIDCFNFYDNDLYVSAQLEAAYGSLLAGLSADERNRVLNAAYYATAKIMQAGLAVDTLDLASFLDANTGAIEGVLFDGIIAEIALAVESEYSAILGGGESAYVFDESRVFENPLFEANGVSSDLVKTVAGFGIYTGIGNSFFSHPSRAGHEEICDAVVEALENNTTGEEIVLDEAEVLIEEIIALVEQYGPEAWDRIYNYLETEGYFAALEVAIEDLKVEIETTIDDAIVDLENPESDLSQKIVAETDKLLALLEVETGEELPSGEEVINAIRNYEETLAQLKAYIDEKIVEYTPAVEAVLTEIEAVLAEIEAILDNPEPYIKNVLDEIIAKYEATLGAATTADYAVCGTNKYVAFAGTNTSGEADYEYSYKFADYIDEYATSTHHFTDGVAIADTVEYINDLGDASDLDGATIVTYQTDAKDLVLPLVDGVDVTADDWAALLDVDAAKVDEIKATIIAALKGEYAGYAADVDNAVADVRDVKTAILAELPADWAETLVAEVSDTEVDEVIASVLDTVLAGITGSLDSMLVSAIDNYAEELVFNVVAYLVNNIKAVEAIKATNPDALIAVVGLHNPVKGLKFDVDGQIVDLGEYVDYFVEATNVYNTIYAATQENVIFVEADETEIAGYTDAIAINTEDVVGSIGNALMRLMQALPTGTVVTENGHNYILNQLKAAITKVDHIDANNDSICDKCGTNLAPATPAPGPVYGGVGGGAASQFVVKFETNGGSKIANVTVKKGEALAKPADPTKEGFDFAGWYTDRALTDEYDFAAPVTKSFTLYAKWAEADVLAKFTDLDKNAWYYEYVKEIVKRGLMKGVSETLFAPEATLTRGMFVTILHRVEGEPAVENAANFTDVPEAEYYAAAVKWANANGIVKGVTETEFAPNAEVTREQMAAMLARYVEYKEIEVAAEGDVTYTDSDAISEYAAEAVKTANKLGILIGNADGSFAPKNNATRAEAAALFVRLLGVLEK